MKLISVVVPVYNEEENIDEAYSRITKVMTGLPEYDYEIVFFDDGSTDGSRKMIRKLCASDEKVKAVFYAKNFGYQKSTFYCMREAKGDCAIIVHADMQNPPENIPEFVEKWEKGAALVLGVKDGSNENKMMFFIRTVFYWLMNHFFGTKMIPHATEFELFSRSFIGVLRQINVNCPFLRAIIADYGYDIDYVHYRQDKRKKGSSKFNLSKYYDFAVGGIVSMSTNLPRKGLALSLAALLISTVELILHLVFRQSAGMAPAEAVLLRGGIILVEISLLFNSLMAEYAVSRNHAGTGEPLIVESERINY